MREATVCAAEWIALVTMIVGLTEQVGVHGLDLRHEAARLNVGAPAQRIGLDAPVRLVARRHPDRPLIVSPTELVVVVDPFVEEHDAQSIVGVLSSQAGVQEVSPVRGERFDGGGRDIGLGPLAVTDTTAHTARAVDDDHRMQRWPVDEIAASVCAWETWAVEIAQLGDQSVLHRRQGQVILLISGEVEERAADREVAVCFASPERLDAGRDDLDGATQRDVSVTWHDRDLIGLRRVDRRDAPPVEWGVIGVDRETQALLIVEVDGEEVDHRQNLDVSFGGIAAVA